MSQDVFCGLEGQGPSCQNAPALNNCISSVYVVQIGGAWDDCQTCTPGFYTDVMIVAPSIA